MYRETPEAIRGPLDGHYFNSQYKSPSLTVRLVSDLGKKRQNNEDSCLLYVPRSEAVFDSRGILIAVADGMGGASAGEYASRAALEQLWSVYYEKNPHSLVPAAMRMAVEAANRYIFRESEQKAEYSGMGTTVSAVALIGNWAYIAHVGDSRIYLCRQGQALKQLTHDHSLVAEQIKNGLINAEEAKNHSLKNLITRAVGIKEHVDVDLFALDLQKDDTLLLCSDGLSNMVDDATIQQELLGADLDAGTLNLLQSALQAGGNDNITIVTARITSVPAESNYQQGAKLVSFSSKRKISRFFSLFNRNE